MTRNLGSEIDNQTFFLPNLGQNMDQIKARFIRYVSDRGIPGVNVSENRISLLNPNEYIIVKKEFGPSGILGVASTVVRFECSGRDIKVEVRQFEMDALRLGGKTLTYEFGILSIIVGVLLSWAGVGIPLIIIGIIVVLSYKGGRKGNISVEGDRIRDLVNDSLEQCKQL